ncbi:E3 ubiquitin-protein ligase TRIM8-like [Electrophorus electricus]|uniref:E3 ubiquitin-protein ligase TRIM8-like n=1 Tax=Electrophorus electricus TaxID=8005 RepID=UPI0015CF85FA|nr:E3 ubiquitin-protein ligase TRIM8-like [Electrophorus electricus]
MEPIAQTLKCPVCADLLTDPVTLPCGHDFCQTCIRIVWNVNGSDAGSGGPLFCPECQIFLPSNLKLEINTDLQRKVQHASTYEPRKEEAPRTAPSPIMCDHCIDRSSVAVKSCLRCDASLCSAHTLLHQQRAHLRGHTLIEVAEDLLSYKCREHGEDLKLFCQEDQAVVCALCVVAGAHHTHQVVQVQGACSHFKVTTKQASQWSSCILHIPSDLRAIHFDAETAHPKLEVSSDMLEVRWSKQASQEKGDGEHISAEYNVLARESFSSGAPYWEVVIWEKPYWLIGLSYGPSTTSAETDAVMSRSSSYEAFCYIYHGNGKYLVGNGSEETLLPVRKRIKKLGVWVNFQRGTVSFHDADTLTLLHSFSVEFLGPVYPVFNPCMAVDEQNTQPLVLFYLEDQKEGRLQ